MNGITIYKTDDKISTVSKMETTRTETIDTAFGFDKFVKKINV